MYLGMILRTKKEQVTAVAKAACANACISGQNQGTRLKG